MRAALGTLIQETTIQVVTGMIGSAEEEKQCLDRKGKIAMAFIFMVCVQDIVSIETNIVIFGGSSGSPVVDFFGRLVGVVFAGDNRTNYGYLVPIRYITDFLSAY
jgi:S1-C subfamily serine protease